MNSVYTVWSKLALPTLEGCLAIVESLLKGISLVCWKKRVNSYLNKEYDGWQNVATSVIHGVLFLINCSTICHS